MTSNNNKMRKLFYFITLIFISLLFTPSKLISQPHPENTKFKHLTVNDGLSDNYVSAILQDKEGFMWLGTSDGLNKYDGYKFIIYRHNPNDSNSIGPGNIRCIYEDKEGFIWIGSEGSLSRFDKKNGKFKVYINDPKNAKSLSNNIVQDVIEDKEGILWISTYGGGLNKFDKKTGKFFAYKNDPQNPNSIASDFVENCFEDSKGIIWIATFEDYKGGLNYFDRETGKFTHYSTDLLNKKEGISQILRYIKEDSKGILWIGNGNTIDGLTAFDKEKKTVINQYKNNPKDKYSLSNNLVQCIYDDSKGHLWVGTLNGLNILDNNTGKFTVFKNDPYNPTSLSNNCISSLFKDNQGLLWIGTGGGGVNIYAGNNNNFMVFKNNPKNKKSLNNNTVYCIQEDSKGVIWMGTGGGGLTNFDKTTDEFNCFNGEIMCRGKKIRIGRISGIQEINERQLWLGMPSWRIFSFDRSTHKYDTLPCFKSDKRDNESCGFIFDLLADSKKTLWAATPDGLFNFNFGVNKIIRYKNDPKNSNSISENFTVNVFEDSQNNVWVSSFNTGLNVYERTTGKFYCFKNDPKNPNSINNNAVNTMYQAPNGVLWLGTNGGGLNALILQTGKNKFTSGYQFYHFTEKDGLPNNVIAGILPDDKGNLWISTNHGLCKFYSSNYLALTVKDYLSKVISDIQKNTLERDNPIYKNYDINDGLPSNSFSGAACKTKDGLMYFGSNDGLLCFHPDSIKDNTHKPSVYFTSFKIFEKEFPLDTPIATKRELILSYKQSFFSFEFVALDYAQPSKNQYAFKMEGFDNKWIEIGNRQFASYTNLDPGEYIFRVKASNNSGIWNEEGASIKIIITPPFWHTKTFYTICILFVIMIVFSYIKWRERKLIVEKKNLEEQVTSRTKDLKEANTEIVQKNTQITDSINYAKRIQQAILPDKNEIYAALPQSFVFYKPKDIVSGDFYFFYHSPALSTGEGDGSCADTLSPVGRVGEGCFLAAADCTGHGVPGAFMSMIGSEKLHDAVQQNKIPGEILMLLNKGIKNTLHQSASDESTRDGMDIALVSLKLKVESSESAENNSKLITHNFELKYAGANRLIWIIRKGQKEIEEIKATKSAIGGFTENDQYFETHEIQLPHGDTFYIFTDGYVDQFGGEKGKKFTTKKFKQLLLEIQSLSMQEQEIQLRNVMDAWSLNREQIDDILIIGVRL